jgi:ubiquinone/menaquinone biosynthesis C-methylase UbiE
MPYIPTGKELIDPFKLLEDSGIRSGMTVADFGCGTLGHYVFPAAKLVGPEGKVYAVDILKSVLSGIESRIKMEGVSNVEMVWGDLERMGGSRLPDNTLDMGLLINNLFLTKQAQAMTNECVRTVKSGGIFVIADWKPTGALGPDPRTRVSAEVARQLGIDAGLRLMKEIVPGPYHYAELVGWGITAGERPHIGAFSLLLALIGTLPYTTNSYTHLRTASHAGRRHCLWIFSADSALSSTFATGSIPSRFRSGLRL